MSFGVTGSFYFIVLLSVNPFDLLWVLLIIAPHAWAMGCVALSGVMRKMIPLVWCQVFHCHSYQWFCEVKEMAVYEL